MENIHHFAVRYPDITRFPEELETKILVHGLHLQSQKPIQVGEPVGLQFRFPQREDPLHARGIIAWVSTQPDAAGKRGLIVKNIDFDGNAREILALVQQTPEVQVSDVVTNAPVPPPPQAAPPQPAAAPPPVASPQPAPAPAADPTLTQFDSTTEFGLSDPTDAAENPPAEDNRKKVIAFASVGVVLLLLLVWLFALGGTRFIAIRLMSPPPALNVAYTEASTPGVEPRIPGNAPPPVKKAPANVVVTGFEYFQRSAVNEFIVTFNRPVNRVVTSRVDSPLVQTFYIERGRVNLDKEQYFLPFDLVRTVSFEVDQNVLRISFVAQNPRYLPEPVYDVRGRELTIRFLASD